MLFKRRQQPSFGETVRVAVWPRRSWSRSTRYLMWRVWRLRGSPRAIAMGCACGVFASFTPLVGFHFVIAGLLAFFLRASVLASAMGTFFGNPLTFPLIWFTSYKAGNLLLGSKQKFDGKAFRESAADIWSGLMSWSPDAIAEATRTILPLVKPMAVGGIPLGIATGVLCYYVLRPLVEAYQARRHRHSVI